MNLFLYVSRPLTRGGGGVAYYYLAFSEDGDAVSAVV